MSVVTRSKSNYPEDNNMANSAQDILNTLARIETEVKKIDPLYRMCSQLQENTQTNAKQINELKAENTVLKDRIVALEQRERNSNIEITGFPQTSNENTRNIVEKIAFKVGLKLEVRDILACHRVPTRVPNKPPNIIAHLRDRLLRAQFVSACKNFNKTKGYLSANIIHESLPNTKIYVNEHLSPDMKVLRATVKQKANESGYKYVWVEEGRIKVRRDKEKPLIIRHPADLIKIVNTLDEAQPSRVSESDAMLHFDA